MEKIFELWYDMRSVISEYSTRGVRDCEYFVI